MTQKSELGKLGENLACEYLVEKGYKIVERNFRETWGELDIIVKSPDKTLVFIEVKTMRPYKKLGLNPEDQLTTAKKKKLQKTALFYANSHPALIHKNKGWRIDLLALTLNGENYVINHYQNI